ncbi:hypothetical protein PHET_09245 [Paragonimus heterotremus]|uniref:Calcineurin-like phosphoesterase domain-containing protein n=1 Tax=Paragonimus heterotremus TaxID=100268 RepID=A0A8J4STA3_9TREM|nr:hypothetical protein PHET_09245 [Paragonimus heterotremus]
MTLRFAVVGCMRPGWTRRVRFIHLFNLLLLFIMLVGEFFLPLWIDWDLPVSKSASDDEVRLLVVADPHVQLYHPYWYYVEYFSLLDSDRYLRRYFRRVRQLTEPDAILILGDLVEGEMDTSNVVFYHAVERLKQLFISSHVIPCFVIPGDNDVGGDWNDPMSTERCERFKSAFSHLSFPKRIKFAKLYGYVPWPQHNDLSFTDDSDVIIFLSHHPIITPYGADFPETMIHLKPAVLISGHDHVAYILRWEQKLGMSEKINWLVPPDARQLPVGSFQLQLDGVLEQSNLGNLVQLGVPSLVNTGGGIFNSGINPLPSGNSSGYFSLRAVDSELESSANARFIHVFYLSFACMALAGELALPLWADWDLPISRHSSEDEVRLLLVADPHVQLYHTYWYYGEYFALMDSDRYLRRYFRRVRRLTQPDAILILGDLVDGDNIVSNDIFLQAAERVKQVFLSSHSTPCFMIPGDNDIGGEGDDPITDQRTERFKHVFGLLSNSQYIRFVHLHGNTPWNELTKPVNLHDTHVTILLSHIPDISSQTVIDLEPDILISGHDHMTRSVFIEGKVFV